MVNRRLSVESALIVHMMTWVGVLSNHGNVGISQSLESGHNESHGSNQSQLDAPYLAHFAPIFEKISHFTCRLVDTSASLNGKHLLKCSSKCNQCRY